MNVRQSNERFFILAFAKLLFFAKKRIKAYLALNARRVRFLVPLYLSFFLGGLVSSLKCTSVTLASNVFSVAE